MDISGICFENKGDLALALSNLKEFIDDKAEVRIPIGRGSEAFLKQGFKGRVKIPQPDGEFKIIIFSSMREFEQKVPKNSYTLDLIEISKETSRKIERISFDLADLVKKIQSSNITFNE